MVLCLLDAPNPPVNAVDTKGNFPLMFAVSSMDANESIVRSLIDLGADVNQQSGYLNRHGNCFSILHLVLTTDYTDHSKQLNLVNYCFGMGPTHSQQTEMDACVQFITHKTKNLMCLYY